MPSLPTDPYKPSLRTAAHTAAVVLGSVALAALARYALNPVFGRRVSFITFIPALAFSAWRGGWPSGIAAILASILAALLLVGSRNTGITLSLSDEVTLGIFVVIGLSICGISGAQHKAQRDAEASAAETRQAAADLQNSEARKSAILAAALDCVISIGSDGRIAEFNPAAEKTFGYSAAEVLGQPIDETVIPPSLRPAHRAGFARYFLTGEGSVLGQRIEITGMRKGGEEFPIELAIVPMQHSGTVGFTAYLRDISERKALEAERERITRREHRIAEQLQEALQPPLPQSVPGLTLADYYRPALEEAGVGGDFADVFAADKGVTFLVVGDLSGKGLAAASQVAIVRNMLRFALYNGRTLAGPVTTLSRTLADNDLLTGFATLFVGRYEASERLFSYVNCGQDAGLILRSQTGQVEALPPTGPILGGFAGANFAEESVRLAPGDILALFTDGLTEAGPSRTALLTGDGVASLLAETAGREADAPNSAEAVVRHVMAGVDAYAEAGIRDDQCLLVAVAS